MNELEEIDLIFSKSQDSLVLQNSDLSLKSISDMVSEKAIDISPKYQRRERWTQEKESSLIESFILNIPVPPIYLAEDEYGTYSVIDGKQRITAIHKFLNGKIKLKGLEKFKEIEGYGFKDLPNNIKNALRIRPYIRIVTLLKQSDSDLKHEVFLRLNKAGVALNNQEIRNVAFRGKMNDLLFELSENDYFLKSIKSQKNTTIYKEMGDVQYVLRFFTLLEKWKSFPGNMDKAMDDFMQGNKNSSATKIRNYKEQFVSSLDACEKIWGDEAFLKPGGNSRVLQGFYDVQMVCLGLLSATERDKAVKFKSKLKKKIESSIKSDEEYANSITQFTSNPKNVKKRISTTLDIMKSL